MNMKVRSGETSIERTLIRTIAGAARPLDEDLVLSELQAIDRLQKLSEKFREQWIFPSPWLVLEDCWTLPATMPVSKMLEDMNKHGKPVGIVGAARLKFSEQDTVLKMFFRKDEKSRKMIEVSAQAVANDLKALRQAVFSAQVFMDPSGDTFSMYYSFHPEQKAEPGSRPIGSIIYTADGRIDCRSDDKQFAAVMNQSKERFNKVVKTLKGIQREQMSKPEPKGKGTE
jgi:hypothetical protein